MLRPSSSAIVTIILIIGSCVMTVTALAANGKSSVLYEYDASFDDRMPSAPTLNVTVSLRTACSNRCSANATLCNAFAYSANTGRCMGVTKRMPKLAEMTSAVGFKLHRRVPPCPTDLGYVYAASLQLCLKFHRVSRTSYGASTFCSEEGSQLAILRTPAEVNYAKYYVGATGGGECIIGGRKQGSNWKWVDATPVESAVLSLATSTNRDCLFISFRDLYSSRCSHSRFFLCRYDVTKY